VIAKEGRLSDGQSYPHAGEARDAAACSFAPTTLVENIGSRSRKRRSARLPLAGAKMEKFRPGRAPLIVGDMAIPVVSAHTRWHPDQQPL